MEEEHNDYQDDENSHLDMDGIEEVKDMARNMAASGEPKNMNPDHKASEVYAPQDHSLWDQNSPYDYSGCRNSS